MKTANNTRPSAARRRRRPRAMDRLPDHVEVRTSLAYTVSYEPEGAGATDCRIRADSDDDGDLAAIVGDAPYGTALWVTLERAGSGGGDAVIEGEGNGDAVRLGSGDGCARREGSGDGIARNSSAGHGNAVRSGSGHGQAERHGRGDGDAVRSGDGDGDAVRTGPGDGNAVRTGDGYGEGFRTGTGDGEGWLEQGARMHGDIAAAAA